MSELYHPRHLSPALWSIAVIVAIALHAGGVGLAFVSKQPDDEPDLGAPAIEIGIELAAPKLEPTDLPVGPDTEAAAPSPAMVEQKAVIEKTDLPKATPTETDDPDRPPRRSRYLEISRFHRQTCGLWPATLRPSCSSARRRRSATASCARLRLIGCPVDLAPARMPGHGGDLRVGHRR